MTRLISLAPAAVLLAAVAACSDASRVAAPRFAACAGPRCGSDQGELIVDGPAGNLAVGGAYHQTLAQVVTPDSTGQVVQISLPIGCDSSGLRIDVLDVNPDGTPVPPSAGARFTRRVPAAAVNGPPEWRTLDLGRGFAVTAGSRFAFQVSAVEPGRLCSLEQGPVGDPYAFGDGWFIALPNPVDVWLPISLGSGRFDLPFETFVRLR